MRDVRPRNQNGGKGNRRGGGGGSSSSGGGQSSTQQQQQQGQRRQRGSGAGSGSVAETAAPQRTVQVESAAGAAAPQRAVQVGPVNTVSSSVQAPEGVPAMTPVAEQGASPAAVSAGSRLRFESAAASGRVPLQFGSAGGALYPPAVTMTSAGVCMRRTRSHGAEWGSPILSRRSRCQ